MRGGVKFVKNSEKIQLQTVCLEKLIILYLNEEFTM